MTPLAIDLWGWTEEDAILYLGITMACGGVLSGICYGSIGPLAKKFDERFLLLSAGLIPMIIGRVCMFPLGSEYPDTPIQSPQLNNSTITSSRAGMLRVCGISEKCTEYRFCTLVLMRIRNVHSVMNWSMSN